MQGKMWIEQIKPLAVVAGLFLSVPFSAAQAPTPVPPGTPVNINVTPGAAAAPPASFTLGPRHGHVIPERHGCTHTGGGNIDVAQPSPDTLIVTMSGAAVAYGAVIPASAAQRFELEQAFEVNFDKPKLKKAKLILEGRVIGLLRTHGHNDTAAYQDACAGIFCGPTAPPILAAPPSDPMNRGHAEQSEPNTLLTLCVPPHAVSGGQNLSVNDHDGPFSVPIVAGKYCLRQTFVVLATAHACLLSRGPSAEFAPDPALDPLWISYKEPFHGAVKKDFGFQVILKVVEDTDAASSSDSSESKEKAPESIPVEPKKMKNGKP